MNNTKNTHLNVGAHRIEKVEDYTYLGRYISFQNDAIREKGFRELLSGILQFGVKLIRNIIHSVTLFFRKKVFGEKAFGIFVTQENVLGKMTNIDSH